MRLLILAACLTVSTAVHCPEQCVCGIGDELEFYCEHVGAASVMVNARKNEFVNIRCEGTNFTCADLPDINLADDQPLPSLMIKGCSPSVLQCLPAVLHASSVAFLYVTESVEPLQPEDVTGLGDVERLMINQGPETRIPSSVVAALPSLRHLRITGTPITLHSGDFQNASQLEYLELSDGVLGGIPEDAFKGLTSLKNLNIWGNEGINETSINALRGLDSLERLALWSSLVTDIPAGTLAHVPRLQTLDLYNNRLRELPPGLLSNLTDLENVTITQTLDLPPLKLYKHSIANLPSLRNLKISDCSSNLPEDLFTGCDDLQTLNLAGNNITILPAGIFKDLKKLETVDLSKNRIEKLMPGVFSPLKQLKYLDLNENHLEELPDHIFSGLRNLKHVSLDDNLLSTISSEAFSGAIALETVSLKNNRLTLKSQYQLADTYENFEDYSPFNLLEELKNLYLGGNQISTMFSDWVMVLNKLQKLDLSRNNFSSLHTTDLQFLSQNLEVDLTHNQISEVILTIPTVYKGDPMYKESTNTVLLDDNPLNCDCWLYSLAMRLKGAKSMSVEPKFVLDNAKCASPTKLQGELFKNVSPSALNCDLPAEKCDGNCQSCEIRPASNELAFNCKKLSRNMSADDYLKNLSEEFGLKHVSIELKSPPQTLKNLNLKLLNVSGIQMTEIPFPPSANVETIDFSNNNLTEIPMEFLQANISLYLANNKFQCDCWNSEDLSILKASKNVLDRGLIKCGDKLLTAMEPSDLCNTWRAAAVASGTFLVLILIVAIIAMVIYRNSHQIIAFIINHGLCPCCFVEDLDDINKEYDVFVSYAHKDRKYLETLMPKLENDFGLKTCVHYRDWFVGDFIPDQINRSVEKSRKTIILLSKNFLDSAYANMEFRAAHNLALKEGRSRVILILIEEVSDHEKLSEDLKAHMKMNTFLKWDDSRFTERLQRAMPLRNNKKFVFPGVFKEASEKTIKSGLDVHLNSEGQLVNVAGKDAV
ncbi:hypothetical protein PYW07_012987 [Mythimna separata]|uniref:TIR domain-containing protein n=1 Tax=Mythimna separata TaxID=271217 RepID=A0AAD8DL15_MYTSE|nr:hypothetical protein PYW07_012987 [Mythimna separata]